MLAAASTDNPWTWQHGSKQHTKSENSCCVQPEWTLDVVLPLGATLTQIVNAVRGNKSASSNTTQTISLTANHVDQTLEPRGANYIEFGTHVNASTQVQPTLQAALPLAAQSSSRALSDTAQPAARSQQP